MANANSKLKIGFVLDDSLDTPDGVQQYVLALSGWLRAQGHDVHYLVGETARTDVQNVHSLSRNVKVRFNGNRMSMPLPANKTAIQQLLQREHFDILHVQMPYSPFMAGRVIAAAPKTTAVVGTFHIAPNSAFVTAANHGLRWLTRSTVKRFDQIMAVSPIAQTFARQTFGITGDIVPNLVDLKPFMNAKALPQYTGDEPVVMFLGRLVERKGCQYLLNAVAKLHRENPELAFKVVVCGKGPLEPRLKIYAQEHNIGHMVEFTGFITEEDKPRYMASADVAVFPSTGGESFGIVVVEALGAAHGAVLAGNNPGYASVMGDHADALFKPTDTAALSAKLLELLSDKNKRNAARTWQRQDAQRFDTPVVGQQVLAQYRTALRKRGA